MGKKELRQQLIQRAREFRANPTKAERKLWHDIRDKQLQGIKFRRQHVIEPFIVDFYCHEVKMIVELDGEVHQTQKEEDEAREQWLSDRGYSIIRFNNQEVLFEMDRVLEKILEKVISFRFDD